MANELPTRETSSLYLQLGRGLAHRTMRDLRKNTDARGHTHFALNADAGRIYARGYEIVAVDVEAGTVAARSNMSGALRTFTALCLTTTHNGTRMVCA